MTKSSFLRIWSHSLKKSLMQNFIFCADSRINAGKLLLVKCSQPLSNWIKKSSLFCFCKLLYLLDLKICFYLKRARSWLEVRVKFSRYSMKSFQRALVGLNNFWIHFIFIKFNWVSMSKIPSPPIVVRTPPPSLYKEEGGGGGRGFGGLTSSYLAIRVGMKYFF